MLSDSTRPFQNETCNTRSIPIVIANSYDLESEGIEALVLESGFKNVSIVSNISQISKPNPANKTDFRELVLIIGIELMPSTVEDQKLLDSKLVSIQRTIILCAPEQLNKNVCTIPKAIGGIISKKNPFQMLKDAIEMVKQNHQYIDVSLTDAWKNCEEQPRFKTTPRQIEIIQLVANGLSSREIAKELGLSRKTVDNHRTRIRHRMNVSSSAEMVNVAKSNGWI